MPYRLSVALLHSSFQANGACRPRIQVLKAVLITIRRGATRRAQDFDIEFCPAVQSLQMVELQVPPQIQSDWFFGT